MVAPPTPRPRRLGPAGRWLPRLCLLVALLAAAAAAQQLHDAWQAARDNRQMSQGLSAPGASGAVLLAHAMSLERQALFDEALAAYAEAEVRGDESVRQAVWVNVANLYLRRGIAAAHDDGHAERAMVMLQLAKAGYRRALRNRPDDWNTRYNFELALRVLPDLEPRNWRRASDQDEVEERLLKDKAAWTDMVGPPRGLH